MRNVPALEAAVLASDYREQAEHIRAGKRNVRFAFEHGRTIGKMLGAVTPSLFQVPGILLDNGQSLLKKYQNNEIFINEWGHMDGALRDLRRRWSMNEKTAMFLGVLFHGGTIAAIAQSANVENILKFNQGMDTIDRTIGNAAVKASRVISGKRKNRTP